MYKAFFQGCIPTKPAKYVQLVSFFSKIIVLRLHHSTKVAGTVYLRRGQLWELGYPGSQVAGLWTKLEIIAEFGQKFMLIKVFIIYKLMSNIP